MMNIEHITGRIQPGISPNPGTVKKPLQENSKTSESFADVLSRISKNDEPKGLQFSSHAIKRLQDRAISLDQQGMQRLQEAVQKAEQKGSKESLILDGEQAFVVSIQNKTVITALDMMEMRERVFTNIDSTVFTSK